MPKLKLGGWCSGNALGAVSGLALALVGCTGVMSGDPNGNAPGSGAGGPPITGGSGSAGVGTGGTGSTVYSKPIVDVMTIRRLNRTQYTNTLQKLTGTTQDHGSKLPPENLSFGFDNIGEALALQPLHIEIFEQSADAVLTELFARPGGEGSS